ncbi:MAG: helix-turn-helix domain-containing protein [Desulfobacterales bacterium]|nr:helix-turn-helix domain-containing protein [Desulfobacterales bacterium]
MNPYENLTPEERLDRICQILVRMIYRAEAKRMARPVGNPIPTPPKPYYGLKETAQKLSVSKRTVQRWIATGKLIAEKRPDGHVLIRSREVDSLIDQSDIKKLRTRDAEARAGGTVNKFIGIEPDQLKEVGIVVRETVNRTRKVLILKCPNDMKVLGDLPDDYFDAPEGKDYYRNKRKVLVRCSKCKQVIFF